MQKRLMGGSLLLGDCLERLKQVQTDAVDLVFTSPPYATKTDRYPGAPTAADRRRMSWPEWVGWMTEVVAECVRVSRGYVGVVANNPVINGAMIPANEHLTARLTSEYTTIRCERPVIWHKNAPPNTRPWWVNEWEPVMFFFKTPKPKTWNWEAVAKPPTFSRGGAFRQRDPNGKRRDGSEYPRNPLARPRDVWRVLVGGGLMGSDLACENEAPFPLDLAKTPILALTNPGDLVFDPFCGSGTTLCAAELLGRRWVGIDCRESQIELSRRRIAEVREAKPVAVEANSAAE
jgi:DNA modification methylase